MPVFEKQTERNIVTYTQFAETFASSLLHVYWIFARARVRIFYPWLQMKCSVNQFILLFKPKNFPKLHLITLNCVTDKLVLFQSNDDSNMNKNGWLLNPSITIISLIFIFYISIQSNCAFGTMESSDILSRISNQFLLNKMCI